MSSQHLPYSADIRWTSTSLDNGFIKDSREVALAYVIGEFSAEERDSEIISAPGLWNEWLGQVTDPVVPISWHVDGDEAEGAPWVGLHPRGDNFLTFFSWPVRSDNPAERINWLRVPVLDQSWAEGEQGDPSGFIQHLTGWKPITSRSSAHGPQMGSESHNPAAARRRSLPSCPDLP